MFDTQEQLSLPVWSFTRNYPIP